LRTLKVRHARISHEARRGLEDSGAFDRLRTSKMQGLRSFGTQTARPSG
jgi:hypothetical protein